MIDRDTVIDFVAAVDTEFMKREVGTYNGFDLYERFAMYVEAKVIRETHEACAKLVEDELDIKKKGITLLVAEAGKKVAAAVRARGDNK
jgi:hypothetical protein